MWVAQCLRSSAHHSGNLQQQAAAAGAVQALAYCPNSTTSLASALAGHGVIEPLVAILNSAPRAMRCAAAGSLCNLALQSCAIQVDRNRHPAQQLSSGFFGLQFSDSDQKPVMQTSWKLIENVENLG